MEHRVGQICVAVDEDDCAEKGEASPSGVEERRALAAANDSQLGALGVTLGRYLPKVKSLTPTVVTTKAA